MEKHKHALLCEFIHHGGKPLKMGCVFPQTIFHSKQQPCLHWKIPQYVQTYGGTTGHITGDCKKALRETGSCFKQIEKAQLYDSRYQSEIQTILQKNHHQQ